MNYYQFVGLLAGLGYDATFDRTSYANILTATFRDTISGRGFAVSMSLSHLPKEEQQYAAVLTYVIREMRKNSRV